MVAEHVNHFTGRGEVTSGVKKDASRAWKMFEQGPDQNVTWNRQGKSSCAVRILIARRRTSSPFRVKMQQVGLLVDQICPPLLFDLRSLWFLILRQDFPVN